jgi:retinol dehydrogenase 14
MRPIEEQTILITGATDGLGRALAQDLARRGATIVVHGRDRERAEAVREQLPGSGHGVLIADLAELAQVRRMAQEAPLVDVLVNNAGIGGTLPGDGARMESADGYELRLAVNHLAPFLLTSLLLDRLTQSPQGRVVTVSSNAQAMGRIDIDDLQGERNYSGARAYNQSKLANVLFTYELARRMRDTSVTANALHPGLVSTSFGAEDPGRIQQLAVPLMRPFMQSQSRGASTSVYLASSPEVERVTGRFYARSKPKTSSKRSYDHALAARLWEVSADLVGLTTAGPWPTTTATPRPYTG